MDRYTYPDIPPEEWVRRIVAAADRYAEGLIVAPLLAVAFRDHLPLCAEVMRRVRADPDPTAVAANFVPYPDAARSLPPVPTAGHAG